MFGRRNKSIRIYALGNVRCARNVIVFESRARSSAVIPIPAVVENITRMSADHVTRSGVVFQYAVPGGWHTVSRNIFPGENVFVIFLFEKTSDYVGQIYRNGRRTFNIGETSRQRIHGRSKHSKRSRCQTCVRVVRQRTNDKTVQRWCGGRWVGEEKISLYLLVFHFEHWQYRCVPKKKNHSE